ncbi:protein tramtrack, beta isoform isoform X3 [Amyelois transitella]|uniref:protein tramtrack, beta isoform isoform X3 n=1 Tax=Amyelois transitella TaxID=680683 RepID=UPI00299082B2|nr:protein tramtrack, beta isoform isoform X3 [Amyelois transitella]
MASDEQFSLCWNNFHANMSAGFHGLLSRGDLVDVTLAAEGRLLQAHKLVLSVCSPYFQEMFKMNPTQHPIVFLKDVSHSALRDLLQFMYQGEVNVKQEELASFISTAEQLQVKGLTGNQNEDSSTPSKPKPTSRPGPRSSQQRQSVMKLETDLDSKPSSTPVAIKRPNRPSIASNNSSSSQSGPAKRKCVDPLEAGPSGSAKEEFVTIPDEDENNAVAPKMEPEFVNESMWDDDEDGANNDETNFGEDDSNMEMTGFDGSATGDGNMSGGGEGGAVGDAQDDLPWSPPSVIYPIQYISRNRGTILLYAGHQYSIKRNNKRGTSVWRCRYRACTGQVVLKDDNVLKEIGHKSSCTPDFAANDLALKMHRCKEIAATTYCPIPTLVKNALPALKDEGVDAGTPLPKLTTVQGALYRARYKAMGKPKPRIKAGNPKKKRKAIKIEAVTNSCANVTDEQPIKPETVMIHDIPIQHSTDL